jgi:predicted ATP-grasp superfamily ATP-dependent carboligase
MKVLVTDGTFKHTLAAVRALGREGYTVDVISYRRGASAAHSRYCQRGFVGPSVSQPEAYFKFLLDLLKRDQYQVLVPIGLIPGQIISKNREVISQYTRFLLPSQENYEIAADKNKTVQYALKLGVPAPQSFWPQNLAELNDIGKHSQFPLVIKLPHDSGNVVYVNNEEELDAVAERLVAENKHNWPDFMVQEYIEGEGYGYFALFHEGELCAQFMHRRLLEYPVTGGASVKAESIYDQRLADLGTCLLSSLKWNGIAMVEFKRETSTQEYKLMEINPKFWGSLDLSIAAGVNFPDIYCRVAMGEKLPPQLPYVVGLQFRWMIRESLFNSLASPANLPGWLRDGLSSEVRTDIDWSDISPHFLQLGVAIVELGTRIVKGNFFSPYGRPKVSKA